MPCGQDIEALSRRLDALEATAVLGHLVASTSGWIPSEADALNLRAPMVRAPMVRSEGESGFRFPGLQRLNAKQLKLKRTFKLLQEIVLNPQPEPLKGCRRQPARRDEAFCRSEAEAKAEAKAEARREAKRAARP